MSEVEKRFYKEPLSDLNEYAYLKLEGVEDINTNNLPAELFEIISIYENDCDQNLEKVAFRGNTLSIFGRSSDGKCMCELELRLRDNKLILKVAEFIHKEAGNFRKLYRILREIRKRYGLNKIFIEKVCTEEMEKICDHYNLVRLSESSELPVDYEEPI